MAQVKGIAFASVYVDDYPKALEFYKKHLDFQPQYEMGPQASWGKAGGAGLYLEGGNRPNDTSPKHVRAAFVLDVESASRLYKQLQEDGVAIIQKQPQEMGKEQYWFQFKDPAGNIIEVLGGK